MASRTVIKLLAKSLLLLAVTLLAWEITPLADYYHRALAASAQRIYGQAASDAVVQDVRLDGEEFAVKVQVGGAREIVRIAASDITGNLCVLFALYLASPIRPVSGLYFRCLGIALITAFGMHVAALYAIVRTAVAWRETAGAGRSAGLIEDMGPWMYPLVILLWAPYLVAYFQRTKGSRPG